MSTTDDLRCSVQLRAAGADLAGSAGAEDGWVLVGWPLPWPRDLGEVTELAGVRTAIGAARAAGQGKLRLQAVVPVTDRPTVVVYRRPPGAFAGYVGQSAEVPAGPDAGDALAAAVAGILATPVAPTGAGRDVLVCTHGRRDRCCGSFGTELHLQLDDAAWVTGAPGTRLWRTSHTGGHRFAPTMVVLGEGTVWGWLDADLVERIVARQGPVTEVLGAYRGCVGLGPPPLQALEREVLGRVGWSLLDTPRTGRQAADDRWELLVGAGESVWSATVTPGARWPVPDCGTPASEAHTSGTAWVVADLRQPA